MVGIRAENIVENRCLCNRVDTHTVPTPRCLRPLIPPSHSSIQETEVQPLASLLTRSPLLSSQYWTSLCWPFTVLALSYLLHPLLPLFSCPKVEKGQMTAEFASFLPLSLLSRPFAVMPTCHRPASTCSPGALRHSLITCGC